jgi:flagellar basal-body rod modification protein FlgD
MIKMSNVTDVTGYDESSRFATSSATTKSSLGKEDFLNLLVTQMKYQDPLEPTDDKEFIAQMAQFTSLEQMNNLNDSFNKYRAYSLVGKNVEATVNGGTVSGFVDSIRINSDGIYAMVDDELINIEKIQSINDTAEDLQVMVSILENLSSINSKLDKGLSVNLTENNTTTDSGGTESTTETAGDVSDN